MFSYGFPKHWSTLRKLLWLKLLQGAAAVVETVTGTLPLTLANALSHAILSLTRYGLCTQDGTPTPDAPVDIMTNNGAIKVSPNLANVISDNIVVGQYIDNSGTARNDSANFFYAPLIPVNATKTYTMHTSVSLAYFSVMEYDSSRGFLRRDLYGTSSVAAGDTITFTLSSDCAFIRFGSNIKKSAISEANVLAINWMLTQTATDQVFRPYGEIYAGGTPEVLTVSGANLFDASSYTEINAYVNANTGVLTAGSPLSNTQYCAVIPCKPNTLYNITGQGTSAWGAFTSDSIGTTATAFTKGGNLTTGANDRYLIGLVRANGDSIDYRNTLVVQEAQTASIPMLLSVGDYKDEGELIQGIKTGKVGILVLNGTESWVHIDYNNLHYYTNDITGINANTSTQLLCTHFGISARGTPVAGYACVRSGRNGFLFTPLDQTIDTVVKFNAFLAGEYAAGTPVIVIYPRATETTEQTTAHNLVTHGGTNIVDSVANVSPLEAKVEYMKAT